MTDSQPHKASAREDGNEKDFGLRELQLALLAGMRPYTPDRVQVALATLGATPAQAAAAEQHWFDSDRPDDAGNAGKELASSIASLRRALGPPVVEEPSDRLRPGGWLARWAVPLWPDLQFEVLQAPSGWLRGSLMRTPGVPWRALAAVEELTPWSCTLRELWAAIGRCGSRRSTRMRR